MNQTSSAQASLPSASDSEEAFPCYALTPAEAVTTPAKADSTPAKAISPPKAKIAIPAKVMFPVVKGPAPPAGYRSPRTQRTSSAGGQSHAPVFVKELNDMLDLSSAKSQVGPAVQAFDPKSEVVPELDTKAVAEIKPDHSTLAIVRYDPSRFASLDSLPAVEPVGAVAMAAIIEQPPFSSTVLWLPKARAKVSLLSSKQAKKAEKARRLEADEDAGIAAWIPIVVKAVKHLTLRGPRQEARDPWGVLQGKKPPSVQQTLARLQHIRAKKEKKKSGAYDHTIEMFQSFVQGARSTPAVSQVSVHPQSCLIQLTPFSCPSHFQAHHLQ